MDLVDRIETTRFIGGEFLLWLWFAQDVTAGRIEVGELGVVEVLLESQLKLTEPLAEQEATTLRGRDPFGSAEADQALRSGKLPRKTTLRLKQGDSEWLVTLDAASLAFSNAKLPAVDHGEDDPLFERMALLEQLDDIVHGLYAVFLNVRLSSSWQRELLPAMRQWVCEGTFSFDEQAWLRAHRRPGKRARRSS